LNNSDVTLVISFPRYVGTIVPENQGLIIRCLEPAGTILLTITVTGIMTVLLAKLIFGRLFQLISSESKNTMRQKLAESISNLLIFTILSI